MDKLNKEYIIKKVIDEKNVKLSKIEKRILLELIENHNNKITISNLADQLFISTSVISRLTKKLNLDGYSELRFYLNNEIKKMLEHSLVDANKVQNSIIIEKIINNLEKINNEETFTNLDKAIKCIMKSKRIGIAGLGFSNLHANYLNYRLNILELDANFLDLNLPRGVLKNSISHYDVIILFSRSAKMSLIQEKIALMKGKKIILITASESNYLEIDPHLVIKIPGIDSSLDYSNSITGYNISVLAIIDLLLINMNDEIK